MEQRPMTVRPPVSGEPSTDYRPEFHGECGWIGALGWEYTRPNGPCTLPDDHEGPHERNVTGRRAAGEPSTYVGCYRCTRSNVPLLTDPKGVIYCADIIDCERTERRLGPPVSGEPSTGRPYRPQRPWCLPCRYIDGSRVWAEHLGVACDWHWGYLSEDDQFALAWAVSQRHPRGGRVRTHTEQIWVVRMDLRQQKPPNTVEETWERDRADVEEMEAANAALD